MLAACGGGKPTAQGPDPKGSGAAPIVDNKAPAGADGDSELQTRGLALIVKMGDMVAGHTGDCPSLGKKLSAFMTEHKPLLDELNADEASQSPEAKKAFEDRHKAELEAFLGKVETNIKKCQGDPDVAAALSAFD
ncbi:MAG: hypothetical protein KF773_12850 [Deltaproteobacteria bacterium]|nr:hypothetical protein [Deltaproteobacteria bacterium]MCW5801470.1 hypothetical protein [Deltaproteobacteria bacterium]